MLTWEYESFAFAFGLNCINKQLTRVKISEWRVSVWGEYPNSIIPTMSSVNISLSRSTLAHYV